MTKTTAGIGTLEQHDPTDLALYHKNPNVGDVDAIAGSLLVNRQYRPVVVNRGTHTGRPMEVLAGNHCVDTKTEALTRRGWVNGYDLREDDTILSCDKDGQLRWSHIKSIFRNWNYDGPMYRLSNQAIDAFVSPGHKFLLSDGTLKPVENLVTNDVIVAMGDAVQSDSQVYSDAFVEVVGWAVTEGNFRVGKARTLPYVKPATRWVRISQKPGPKADRIELALKRCGAEFKVGKSGRQGRVLTFNVAGEVANKLHDIAPNRVMSLDFINELSSDQRRLLIETMIDGDGYRHGVTRYYVQRDPEHMAALAYLAALSGFTSSQRLRVPPETTGEYRNAKPYLEMTIHGDGERSRRRSHFRPKWRTEEHYKGLIWCPETEYGTFVARRGGKVYVTGNTVKAMRNLAEQHPDDLDWQIIDCYVIDVDNDRAARIVLADNRTAELGTIDDELLLDLIDTLPDLDGTGYDTDYIDMLEETVGHGDGIDGIADDTDDDRAPNTGELLQLLDVTVADPEFQPDHGTVWQLGHHILVIARVTDEHELWVQYLDDGVEFSPYPNPALTLTDRGRSTPMVLVQPNRMMAGVLMDLHQQAFNEEATKIK